MDTLSDKRRGWFAPAFVFVIAFAVFARSIAFDFVWDDWLVIVRNPRINPPSWTSAAFYWTHVAWNLYMPVTCSLWIVLARLGQLPRPVSQDLSLNPYVFHLANVLLHASVALAAYHILLRVVRQRGPAIAGALLFAVHPLQVETICFVGAVNNLLATLFAFLALGDYLNSITGHGRNNKARKLLYARGLVLLCLALLSRPMVVVLPAIAFVLDLAAFRRPLKATIHSIVPWVILVLPCAIWTMLIQHGKEAGGAVPALFRPLVALDSIGMYLWRLLIPMGLSVDYGRTPAQLYQHPAMLVTSMATITLVIIVFVISRQPAILLAALTIFVIGLIPSSGLVPFDFQQYSTVADRYAYLAMLGPALAVAGIMTRPAALVRPRLFAVACTAIILVLSILSIQQSSYWRDDRTLFTRAIQINPRSWLGHQNLAFSLLNTDPSAAVRECELALNLRPQSALAWRMLALARLSQGKPADAVMELRRALDLNPADTANRRLLASVLEGQGNLAGAIFEYRRCLAFNPNNAEVHTDLAAVLADSGQFDEAAEHYQWALQIDPLLQVAKDGLRLVIPKSTRARHAVTLP